jgi:hypothetical protein
MPSFTFFNPGGELTFSGDGLTYGYIGRATPYEISQPSSSVFVRSRGASTYKIDWPGDIVVALPVKSNGVTALLNMTQSGNTWTITVFKANGNSDSKSMDYQEYTEVYVFGLPVPGSGSVFMLYDVNGNPCADLTRQPLTYKARLHMDAGVISWDPPSAAVTPAILGWPDDYKTATSRDGATSFYNNWDYERGWQLIGSSIMRLPYVTAWSRDDGGLSPSDFIYPIDAIYIDVNGLH